MGRGAWSAIQAVRAAADPLEAEAAGETELRCGLERLPEEIRELVLAVVGAKMRVIH